jgi:hypothetical protein
MPGRSIYREMIEAALRNSRVNPRIISAAVVEAWMRLKFPTLDSLSGEEWTREVRIAIACAKAATPEENAALAKSYGLETP